MNLQQAKIILEKINRLYQSMTLDSKIDPFEQELMLSYIEKFHNAFSSGRKSIADKKESKAEPVVVSKPAKKVTEEQPKAAAPPPPPPPAPAKEIKKVKEPVVEVEVPKPPTPKVETPPAPAPSAINEDLEILFDQKQGKELSDKLSSLPIKDLTKAMGLNEKILTTNELFNKDSGAFDAAMKDLNNLRDFEEAKMTLATLAEKYNWTARNRKKKAQIFIKLVQRKFK